MVARARMTMERHQLTRLIDGIGPRRALERLRPYVTESRQQRIEQVLQHRVRTLHVAVERPHDPHNAAAIVRTAEALGCGPVHAISDISGILRARKTTKGAMYWVETHHYRDLGDFLAIIRSSGMRLAGACVHGRDTIDLAELPIDRPLCVMFGNESTGLSDEALAACDHRFTIPMVGMSESLNLSVSAGITLHDLLQRKRGWLATRGRSGDGDNAWLVRTRVRWYARALDDRLVRHLLAPEVDVAARAPAAGAP